MIVGGRGEEDEVVAWTTDKSNKASPCVRDEGEDVNNNFIWQVSKTSVNENEPKVKQKLSNDLSSSLIMRYFCYKWLFFKRKHILHSKFARIEPDFKQFSITFIIWEILPNFKIFKSENKEHTLQDSLLPLRLLSLVELVRSFSSPLLSCL